MIRSFGQTGLLVVLGPKLFIQPNLYSRIKTIQMYFKVYVVGFEDQIKSVFPEPKK